MKKLVKSLLISLFAVAGALCLLLAACGGKKVTLNFVTDGDPVESVSLEVGEEYTLPVPKNSDGWEFEGWYLDAEYTGSPVESVVAEQDTTFYAKWAKTYAVALELDGGTLQGGDLRLKAGENIAGYMKDRIPQKAGGFEFGEWLYNGRALSSTETMPSSDITLTAHWKVQYTVHLFLQKLEGTEVTADYEAGEDYVGYDYPAESYTVEPSVEGFTVAEHAGAKPTGALTGTPANNVFTLYLDRNSYTVFFSSNYPAEAHLSDSDRSVQTYYGVEIKASADYFSVDGYLQTGWSTSAQGEAEYETDTAMTLARNATRDPAPDKITVRGNLVLFAVWNRGYVDMFGSGDTVYRFSDEATEVYLRRGDVYFVGEYRAARGVFIFQPDNAQKLLTGKFNEDGTFTYSESTRTGTRYLYEVGVGIDMSVSVAFDAFNGVTYTRLVDSVAYTAEGSYQLASNGLYLVTFTQAMDPVKEMLEKQWTMRIGSVAVTDESGMSRQVNGFQFRNEEDYRLGTIPRAVVYNGQVTSYDTIYSLTLDGFGTATYVTETGAATYSYIYDEDAETIRLISTSGTETIARILEIGGTTAYMIYDEEYAHEYTSDSGATLELDGLYRATYHSAAGQKTGYYTLSGSVFGTLVTVYENATDYETYLVRTIEEPAYNDEGEQIVNYYYRFEEKLSGYGEWHYYDAEARTGYYYAPLLVLNESEAGKAGLYGYTTAGTYEKVADGSYSQLTEGHYLFTVDEGTRKSPTVMTSPYDLSKVKSFVFELSYGVDPYSAYYPVMFWTSYTDVDSATHAKETTVYRSSEEGSGDTVTTIADTSFMVYTRGAGTDGEEILTGFYSTNEDGVTTLYVRGAGVFYLHLDETGGDKKFTVLSGLIGWLTLYTEEGSFDHDVQIFLDGAGGAKYVERTDGEVTTQVEGSYTYSADNVSEVSGRVIYTFTPKDTAQGAGFMFIAIEAADSTFYFAKKSETIEGKEYTNADGSLLILDGFGYEAKLMSADGSAVRLYVVMDAEEKVIALVEETGSAASTLYFDLAVEEGTFTARGSEYALYCLVDNMSGVEDTYIRLDGRGAAKVYTMPENADTLTDEDGLTLVGTGIYSAVNGVYTIEYTPQNKSDTVTLVGVLGAVYIGSTPINAFFIRHEEVVSSYVNDDDFSVITLDDHGNATYADGKGAVEYGQYKIINDKLFYFENSDSTDAAIYEYNKATASAKPLNYDETAYYTDDLEAMLFTRYGFMLLDGTSGYYYSVDDEGNVTLYHQDFSLPVGTGEGQRNVYGFTAESFGTFAETKEWGTGDARKSYHKHDGYSVIFAREEETKDQYPVQLIGVEEKVGLEELIFSPTGSAEFEAPGHVRITLPGVGTEQLACTVHRYKDGDAYKMYFTAGNFRFDIDLTFSGSDSTQNKYAITSMKSVFEADSYLYLYYAFVYLYTQGVTLANNFGTITITDTYNTAGEIEEGGQKVTGEFFINSGLVDLNGDYLNFTDEAYTYSEEEDLYTVDFEGKDGQKYRLRFALTGFMDSYAYRVVAMTRIQTLEFTDPENTEYSLEVERIIGTELTGFGAGDVYAATLKAAGEELPAELIYERDGKLYYYVRTRDAAADEDTLGKIASSVLYTIELKEKALDPGTAGSGEAGSEDEEERPPIIPLFDTFTLQKRELSVAYDEDGESYIEYYKEGENVTIVHFNRAGRDYLLASEGQVKNADGSFTVTTTAGTVYKITIDDNSRTATFEIVVV